MKIFFRTVLCTAIILSACGLNACASTSDPSLPSAKGKAGNDNVDPPASTTTGRVGPGISCLGRLQGADSSSPYSIASGGAVLTSSGASR